MQLVNPLNIISSNCEFFKTVTVYGFILRSTILTKLKNIGKNLQKRKMPLTNHLCRSSAMWDLLLQDQVHLITKPFHIVASVSSHTSGYYGVYESFFNLASHINELAYYVLAFQHRWTKCKLRFRYKARKELSSAMKLFYSWICSESVERMDKAAELYLFVFEPV